MRTDLSLAYPGLDAPPLTRLLAVPFADRLPRRRFLISSAISGIACAAGCSSQPQEAPATAQRSDVPLRVLLPAFILSELKVAFLMGFKVYLPFLIIDMVIASLLISMSMMMLPPVLISLPFKLLLFVLVDGWQLLVGSLLTSFAQPEDAVRLSATAVSAVSGGGG